MWSNPVQQPSVCCGREPTLFTLSYRTHPDDDLDCSSCFTKALVACMWAGLHINALSAMKEWPWLGLLFDSDSPPVCVLSVCGRTGLLVTSTTSPTCLLTWGWPHEWRDVRAVGQEVCVSSPSAGCDACQHVFSGKWTSGGLIYSFFVRLKAKTDSRVGYGIVFLPQMKP